MGKHLLSDIWVRSGTLSELTHPTLFGGALHSNFNVVKFSQKCTIWAVQTPGLRFKGPWVLRGWWHGVELGLSTFGVGRCLCVKFKLCGSNSLVTHSVRICLLALPLHTYIDSYTDILIT